MDETYHQALNFCQSSTRENGIDAALHHEATPPVLLHGLLVPPDIGQTYQIAAQAGMVSPSFVFRSKFRS